MLRMDMSEKMNARSDCGKAHKNQSMKSSASSSDPFMVTCSSKGNLITFMNHHASEWTSMTYQCKFFLNSSDHQDSIFSYRISFVPTVSMLDICLIYAWCMLDEHWTFTSYPVHLPYMYPSIFTERVGNILPIRYLLTGLRDSYKRDLKTRHRKYIAYPFYKK